MRRWILGIAVAFVAAGVAVADEKAEAVVKKAIAAQGGAETLNKYKAGRFNMKGQIPVMGTDTEFTGDIAFSLPGKAKVNIYIEVAGMKVSVMQTMNGDKFKRVVKVGDMVVQSGDENKDEAKVGAAEQEVERLTPLLDPKRFTIKSGGEEDVNGKKTDVLLVTPKTVDKELKLFVERKSGLIVKTAHRGIAAGADGTASEVLQEKYYSDFKKVEGIQVPMKLEVHHDGKKFMTATVSDYEMLEKIDDKDFAIDADK